MSDLTHLDVGPLAPFHTAGILGLSDVQVATALMRIGGHPVVSATCADAHVALGAALCVRALRAGSVCVDLTADPGAWVPEGALDDTTGSHGSPDDGIADQLPAPLPWPEPDQWLTAARAHPLVTHGPDGPIDRPLRLVGDLLYLQRYWLDEQLIRLAMMTRARAVPVDPAALAEALARLFPDPGPDRQRLAAAMVTLRGATIIAGGPGTGKTTTVARIIALLRQAEGPQVTVALAAPTGKAAARLQEAVATAVQGMDPADRDRVGHLPASTLHRLLGWRPDSQGRFRHDRSNPLPHDVVIVDETSMVSLPLMARLLDAVRPDARLVLVGDPDQLASIDAGAVLGDLVAAPPGDPAAPGRADLAAALTAACPADGDAAHGATATGVVVLNRNFRFGGAIADLAAAIRRDDPDEVLAILRSGHTDVEYLDTDAQTLQRATRAVRAEVVTQTGNVVTAATAGDAAAALTHLESHRVLCAHREGPHGVSHWSALIEGWTEHLITRPASGNPWYVGRPLLVTANDYATELYNGDTGVIVAQPNGDLRAAFPRAGTHILLPPARLDTVQTLHAMTIHRGQGSQFDTVTVILPPPDSPLLTRELLYTAVTRARTRIRIVGTEQAVRAGVHRQVRRASGLRVGTLPRLPAHGADTPTQPRQ